MGVGILRKNSPWGKNNKKEIEVLLVRSATKVRKELIDIRTVLIHRISSQSSSVSEVTMELFNCLLSCKKMQKTGLIYILGTKSSLLTSGLKDDASIVLK